MPVDVVRILERRRLAGGEGGLWSGSSMSARRGVSGWVSRKVDHLW